MSVDKSSIPYAGIQTFLGREYRTSLKGDEDVIVLGIPLDSGASYLPGTRLGPSAIRRASMILKFYSSENGLVDTQSGEIILKNIEVIDMGDLELPFGDQESALKRIYSLVKPLTEYTSLKIFLGGDHSITYPLVKTFYEKFRDLYLIHIDAHLDILPSYAGNKYTHASPIYRIINDLSFKPSKIIQLGLRGYVNSVESYNYARGIGERIYSIDEIRVKGLNNVMNEVLNIVGDSPVYITFDTDALDPSIAPGTGVIEPGGLTYPETRMIMKRLGECNVVAADFVEVSPLLDHNDITAKTITYLILDLISRFSKKKVTSG